MRRLVYCYVSNGSCPEEEIPKFTWSPRNESREHFAGPQLLTEGFYFLFQQFIHYGFFDEILFVIESSKSPGHKRYHKGIEILVVPNLSCLHHFTRRDDIMWFRGGWRSWFPVIEKYQAAGHWILFYRANTNRGAWPFWDIVLDDLIEKPTVDELGRFYYPIGKPTNTGLFYPEKVARKYDLCIGASHVHDKKGQWRIVEALVEYQKLFRRNLKCILPGEFHNGVGTNQIHVATQENRLDIEFPGMLNRNNMVTAYNMSKLLVHAGTSGQGDRGPLEAMACGCPVAIGTPRIHAPFVQKSPFNFQIDFSDHIEAAKSIHSALKRINRHGERWRTEVKNYYEAHNGIENVIIPQFKRLFDVIRPVEKADRRILRDTLPVLPA